MNAFRWRSLVTLIVAISVLLSTWLSFGQINDVSNVAAWLTALAAVCLLVLGILSLAMRKAWLAGLRLLVGGWLVVSPWILGYGAGTIPTLILVVGGVAVIAVAAFDLYRDFRHESDVLSHTS